MRWSVIALMCLAVACALPGTGSGSNAPEGEMATLVHVDDGDSFIVEVGGREERVRLIGINAPERGECLSSEARARLEILLEGRDLMLVPDVDDRDRFDRLLRYVYVDDVLVNATMAAEGLALTRSFDPNVSRQRELDESQATARQERIGLWNPAACGAVEADVVIDEVEFDPPGLDLDGEYVVLVNRGDRVALAGWSLRDETSQHRYRFPDDATLEAGAALRVFTGCGTDGPDRLHWCSDSPVWDNTGDTVLLISPTGSIHAFYSYGG